MKDSRKGRKTRAQAALEFMMTYGWMMLVLAGSIGALVYFMPNPRNLTPGKCIFGTELSCLGSTLSADNLTIVLRNNAGQSIYNVSANSTVPLIKACNVSSSTLATEGRLVITCQNNGVMNLTKDSKIKMLVKYKKVKTGYDKSVVGDVYAKYR